MCYRQLAGRVENFLVVYWNQRHVHLRGLSVKIVHVKNANLLFLLTALYGLTPNGCFSTDLRNTTAGRVRFDGVALVSVTVGFNVTFFLPNLARTGTVLREY